MTRPSRTDHDLEGATRLKGRTIHLPTAPQITGDLTELDDLKFSQGLSLERVTFGGDFTGVEASRIEFSECRVKGAILTAANLADLRLTDVIFEDCELSGCIMPRAVASRVEFRGCRMSGVIAPDSKWQDVKFLECKIDQASFRMSTWVKDQLSDSILSAADFYSASFQDVSFLRCNLGRVDLTEAKFRDVYLHGSLLDDLKLAGSLQGITISTDQVIPMSLALFSSSSIRVNDDAIE